ncbi:hypothetical protein C810_01508 [Lachnospiraceae bacterium A2]|nr:hypothetical protein C810_01508 [Lachnospiraceae bacterium A2]
MIIFGKRRNETNSSMGVTCIAKGKCKFRYTTLFEKCKNNLGKEKRESYFEPRERDNQ